MISLLNRTNASDFFFILLIALELYRDISKNRKKCLGIFVMCVILMFGIKQSLPLSVLTGLVLSTIVSNWDLREPMSNVEWEKVSNKVCYGKYISPNRVGYGYYGKVTLDEAKRKCKEDVDCQSVHRDRHYGYYYYTGKDLNGNVMNESNRITDNQKGTCTKGNAQVQNDAELYIKKIVNKPASFSVTYESAPRTDFRSKEEKIEDKIEDCAVEMCRDKPTWYMPFCKINCTVQHNR